MNTYIKRVAYTLCTLLSLVVFSSSSHAEWVGLDDSDTSTIYADSASVKVDGKLVKVWTLTNYKEIQTSGKDSYISMKVQRQYNCNDDLSRSLFIVSYLGHMGTGRSLEGFNVQNNEWRPVIPTSRNDAVLKWACKYISQ